MSSRLALAAHRRAFRRAVERASGRIPLIAPLGSVSVEDRALADISRLPVATNDTELQDGSGNFYFLVGYSQAGGTDVLR